MTYREAYTQTKRRLLAAGIPSVDAACLFEKHTGVTRHRLALCGEDTVENDLTPLWEDVRKRLAGEPLQYLLGQWEFMGLPFYVGPGVLIPRPETELLAETAAAYLRGRKAPRLLELCAGSGCVSLSAAHALANLQVLCVELSGEAMGFLQKNIQLHGLGERVAAVQADVLAAETVRGLPGKFDAIVCNPPYIPSAEIASLQPEVRREPRMALDGGADGLLFYRALTPYLSRLLPGGLFAVEVGAGQAPEVTAIFRRSGLDGTAVLQDFAAIGRVVQGFLPAKSRK